MDNNLLCPSHKCDLMKLLPILMDIDTDEEIILLPSQLNKELQMSTEERLTRLCKPTRKYRINTEVNTFSRTPDIIVFQNFQPGLLYKTTLSFLNLHPVSRHLRVVSASSPYFEIDGPINDCSAKLAPGISYTLNVVFLPTEYRNYIHHITIITDTETFSVPVYGLTGQALLNLPDRILLPSTAVNVTSKKQLVLHNFGRTAASFIISLKDPFSVSPYKHLLPAGEFIELRITCNSPNVGHIEDCMHFSYNNIKLMVHIECEVYSLNTYLDKDSISFQDIYMGLKRQETITVYNRSDHFVDFKWKLHKSFAVDQLETSNMITNLEGIKELEKKRSTKLERMNVIDHEGHSRIYDKLFEDKVAELKSNNLLLYKNIAFDILPLEGKILPNKSQTFIVTFAPNKNEHYESWAYLDATGSIDRIPLHLCGTGRGPYVSLNVKVLNIGDVFLCATHNYEIALKNEGNIPATIVFKDLITDFDGIIKCVPKKVYLPYQDTCSAFIMSFYSEFKGTFIETIQFVVKESGEVIQFVLTGNVVCPLLKMDIQGIDFGRFPFGEQQSKKFLLKNECQVPIDFKIVLEENISADNEIEFEPDRGIVDAYTDQLVSVQLNLFQSKEVNRNFRVIMWGSEQYSFSKFIKYTCISPTIKCDPPEIKIKFCFINFEYKRTIVLKNQDNVSGAIIYTPPEKSENDGIICALNKTNFMIHPYQCEEIELSLQTNALGINEMPLVFTVAGNVPQELCRILLDGQGPVISYRPEEINFNEITLLHTVVKELTLGNDSPIPATVRISKPPESVFNVDVDEIDILPDEEKVINVSVYLVDVGKYADIINVKVENGESIDIKVFGEGIGHSLLCEPTLNSEYDLEELLTFQQFTLPIKMTNLGRRYYKVRWTSNSSIKHLKDKLEEPNADYCFRIKPEYFELSHLQSQLFEIQGQSKLQKHVAEEFFCYALINKLSKMCLVMSLTIKARFVEPSLTIKKPLLDVLVVENDCIEMEDQMSIVNNLTIPVNVILSTSDDYFIRHRESYQKNIYQKIEGNSEFSAKVKFSPNLNEKRYFKRTGLLTINYVNHPKTVSFDLSTEVCFPTVNLTESQLEFSFVPLNSYSFKNVIIQNVTFLPAKYSWEILEEFFEIEKLPLYEDESDLSDDLSQYLDDFLPKAAKKRKETFEELFTSREEIQSNIGLNVSDYTTDMKNVLLPTVQRFVPVCNEQYLFEDTNSIANYDEYKIRNILTIEPFRGQLDAYEYGIVTIGFFPPPNTRIRAKAICKVEGGEYETLSIVGTSCKVSYKFNKKYVDFGIQLFCEICENTIVLTNNGYCLFNYLITCDDIEEEGADLEPGWLNVSPNSGTLLPNNSTTLTIKYFPGKVGQFSKSFRVVIGYLDPFEIKIYGFAVFSQVFAYIPRPLINDQPVDLSYKAISILSMNYLRRVNEISTVRNTSNQSLDLEVLSKLSEDAWVVISKDDYYPSTMDIHLSIERLLLAQLLMENPNILHSHTFTRKVKIIPEFKTPPYQLDFGYVVVETSVCYTVTLLNYGPTVTDVKLMKNGMNMEKNKFMIEYSPKKLEVGETINLHVIFRPTLKRYQQPDVNIKEKFSLIVAHGATIPILINATVTLPRLGFNFKFINFGAVQIGQCLRKHLMIKNDGHVPCKWKVECRKKYTYFVSPTEGELLPGKNDILDVYFMPTVKDYLPGKLYIYIEGNPTKTSIQLCGYGIGVGLVFNCSMLKFRSALPYTNNSIIIFIVQNVSDRPVEFCFADYNQQYAQEKLWINTYFNSNNVKSMLVPERNAGHKLHNIFEDNYLIYVNELRKKLLKTDQYDSEDSETNEEMSEESVDPLLKYSRNEISKMLNELIESKQTPEDSGSTDIPEINETFPSSMMIVEPETDKTSVLKIPQNGIFIIFHGGPNTEYFKAANWAGLRLKIPIYSIDRLIYEALVENSIYSANEINRLIDEKFEYTANEEDLDPVPGEDEYDTLIRKVYVILYTTKRTKIKNAKGKAAEKGNKTSEKSSTNKSKKKDKDFNTLGDIPLELFEDLLKYKFRSFVNGVIIESLHSEFLRKINIALNSLLNTIGNAKYIHIILLSYTLQNYIQDMEDKIAEKERIAEELKATGKEITREKSQSKTFKKSSRGTSTSGKSSKKSKKPQKEKLDKTLLKDMPKDEKDAFDSFQELLTDTFDLCQFWDRRGGFRNKTGTRSLKSESKDDTKDLKSTQQKKKISYEETSDEIGIFLWVISHANQERPIDFSDIIYAALKENPDLQEAKKDLADGIDVKKDSVLFTIMTKLDNSDTGKSNFFTISTNDQITDRGERRDNDSHGTKSSISLLSTKGISSRKKTSKHHKIVEEKINPPTREIDVPFDNMSRRILEPEEVAYYTFTFSPKKCGEYNHNFTVQITGLNSDFVLNCSGICELPTIDFNPHVMFPNVRECYRDKDMNTNFVYIKEMNVLDFGLVFFDADNPHKYEYHIVLKNISRLPCDVKASLGEKTSYCLPSNVLHVDPDQEMLLPISVKATKSSILESDLCISVKNNPVSKLVKLVTKPCKVDCQIKPKMLTFDKVPVNCGLQKKISLCNLSPVNLLWKFVDFDWALQIFQISKTEGFLGPFSVFDVFFSYTPLREESYAKKQLVVQLFDINYSDKVPLYVDSLTLHADSVECIVEYSDHIDLGDIKGGQEHKISYTLMNKGQHNTCITFSKIDNPLDKYKNVRKCFNLMNTSEILYPNRLFTGTLTFNPLKPMVLAEVPIFVCNFIECMHPENVMKSIVIKISAKVFFSSFEISPSGDINFGHQQIFSTKAHTLELKNTGRFPLSYTITYVNPEELTTEKSVPKKSKIGISGEEKASRVTSNKKSKESKEDKKKSTKLNAGCFSIQPSIGEVMPNDIAHIEIECYPKENEEYKEAITLSVSESLDEERHIMLTVIGCEPKMDFHNFRRIFKEHYIVDKLEVLDVPKITVNYCIYESSEQTLHFKKVSLNTEAVSNIYMQNTGHVIAYVTTKIDDGTKNVFKVSPSSIDVDPFSTKSLSIIFKPECVGEAYCKLEITYNSSTNNKFSVALIGEGVMPKLMLIKPNLEENNKSSIRFLPTYIGSSRTQRISIKNVCSISAKAILQINNNVNEALTLIACEDTCSMLNICDLEEIQNTKYSTLVNLNPEETANFDLKYTPKCEDILAAHVKIHTVNNPFEVVLIAVSGRSYYHDIILEELPPCHIIENNIIGYQINFNFAFLHYLQKKSFSIINNSEQFTYKFEFTNLDPLAFIPRVGHLKPLTNKEIIVSFCTIKPLHFDKDLVKCTINKIEYVNPDDSDGLTWDERHKYIAWDISQSATNDLSSKKHSKASYDEEIVDCCEDARKSVKNIIARSEPEFRIISETSEIISCLLSVTADYSTYINKVSDINFPDTYINEKTKRQFEIENNGVVPLKIEWNFTNVKTVETRATSAVEKKDEANDAKNDFTRPISANSLFTSEPSQLYVKEPEIPFTISPQKTLIYPNTTQEFTVQFWPLNLVNSCMNLQSNIVGLKPQMKNINIKVTGKSLMPIYYFELEQSNYMSRRPDGVKKCNVPDYVDSKVIEFESVGVGVLSLRKFCVVNPGKKTFTYKFESLEKYPPFSYFDCKASTGVVKKGKKSEIIFTFKSHAFGNFEGYYMFQIPDEKISVPFLLAGRCREPHVYFTQSHISLKPTVLNVPLSTKITLWNEEYMELSFKFHKESFFNDNQDQELNITPKKGKLRPHSEQIIEVTFKAEKIGDTNFLVLCTVENVPAPLTLNISAQCEEVVSLITYWDKSDVITKTLDKDKENIINFGMITPKKKETLEFSVSNKGKTGFFYMVQLNAKPVEHFFRIDVSQRKEFVASNKTSSFIMNLEAQTKATLKDFKVKINISYGPTYLLSISAKAESPLIKLSFQSYNFGYCIVQKSKSAYYNVTLEIKNIGTRVVMLENLFEDNDDLTIDFKNGYVQPSSTEHLTIYFHPMNVGRHEINVPLKVNLLKYVVKIMGEAVNVNLQLVKGSDKYIDLGQVLVGTAKRYAVQVINKTPTNINVFFDLWERLPFHTRPKEKIYSEMKLPDVPEPTKEMISNPSKIINKKKNLRESTKGSTTKESKKESKESKEKKKLPEDDTKKTSKKSQNVEKNKSKDKKKNEEEVVQDDILELLELRKSATDFLKISPKDYVQIAPDKKFQFTIEFMPTERLESFTEKIFYEIQDHIEPLCVVTGYCFGPKFLLSQEHLKFSNVVTGLTHTAKTLLRNMGDFKGRFQFKLDKRSDIFRITPLTGFVGPSSELEICVTFAPKAANCIYKTKADCLIGGLEKPLQLILEGSSTKIPSPISTLQFQCPVREKTEQNIKIVNITKERWIIHSFISSDQFSTEKEFIVEPDAEYVLDVIYKPEIMTSLAPHNATLFLPLPEGKAIIYKLVGQTLPPLPINKITLDVKCKMYNTHALVIRNWMNTKQNFKVTTELMTPLTPKCLYKVSGNSIVELLPNEHKHYNWKVYIVNEIPLDFKVTFTNIETKEYMYYEISVNVLPSDPVETKTVVTCVRNPVNFTLILENPIDHPVTFTIECDLAESIFDQYVTLEPYTKHHLPFQYCPLKSDEVTTYLYAICPELGTYTYCLKLIAKPPLPENTVRFKAELGEKVYRAILWKNTFRAPVEFTAKFDHPVFSLEKVSPIPEGESGRLKFGFEPSQLGILQSKAIVFSPHTGNYIYPLIGECVLPTPKGPFVVKPGGSTQINFVNPFMEDQTFNFYIDSNAFYLKTTSETIKAKKSTKIVVNMQALKYLDGNVQSGEITAKLHVEVAGSSQDHIKWVFYIQSEV